MHFTNKQELLDYFNKESEDENSFISDVLKGNIMHISIAKDRGIKIYTPEYEPKCSDDILPGWGYMEKGKFTLEQLADMWFYVLEDSNKKGE